MVIRFSKPLSSLKNNLRTEAETEKEYLLKPMFMCPEARSYKRLRPRFLIKVSLITYLLLEEINFFDAALICDFLVRDEEYSVLLRSSMKLLQLLFWPFLYYYGFTGFQLILDFPRSFPCALSTIPYPAQDIRSMSSLLPNLLSF